MTHIYVGKLTIIGSDNGLSPDRRQAIIWTNVGLLLIGPLATNFSEILIEILIFSFKKIRLKVSSAKRRPFCLGLNVLITRTIRNAHYVWWSSLESLIWPLGWIQMGVQSYNFTKIAATLVICMKKWNTTGFVIFTCPMFSWYSFWTNLPFVLWFSWIFHCLKAWVSTLSRVQIDGSWFDHQRLWVLLMVPIYLGCIV